MLNAYISLSFYRELITLGVFHNYEHSKSESESVKYTKCEGSSLLENENAGGRR